MVKVALCWDDGVRNDIRVIGLLKKYHAKATFNLNPGYLSEEGKPACWRHDRGENQGFKGYMGGLIGKKDLREVYGDFQVASHCWEHEDVLTADFGKFIQSAVDARNFLEDLFERPCSGFAWPYGHGTFEAARALSENGFTYGRLVGSTDNILNCPSPLLLTPSCHYQDRAFWKIFEAAKKTCGIFYFWGHSYEMLDSEGLWQQLEYKLEFLDADPEVEWIDVCEIPAFFAENQFIGNTP